MTRLAPAALVLALGAGALLGAGSAAAQDRQTVAFEAAEQGAQTENIPGGTLLVVAYAAAWLLLFGYLFSIGMRQSAVSRDLQRLREDLEAAEQRAGGPVARAAPEPDGADPTPAVEG